jgi:hypothetical protein
MALKKSKTAKPSDTNTRDVPALDLRAAVSLETFNAEKRTVDVVFATPTKVRRGGFWSDPFDEELSMDPECVRMERLSSGKAPVLDSHNSYGGVAGVLGVVQKASVDGKRGVATLRFSKAEDDADADQIFRKIGDGIIANVSVGYRVHKYEKQPRKDPNNFNEVPVMRAIDWEPFEISPVGLPADPSAGFRFESPKPATNACEFVTRNADPEEHDMEKTAAELAAAEATRAGELAARTALEQKASEAARAEGKKAEQERQAAISLAVRAAKLETAFATKLIADDVPADKARAMVIDELAKRSEATVIEGHHIGRGEEASDKFRGGMQAWLIQRAGLTDLFTRAKKMHPERFADVVLDPTAFRGFGMVDVAREYLERVPGAPVIRGIGREDLLGRALTERSTAGGQSTSDFAVLLENVMNKTLLAAYLTTPDTWTQFCMTSSANDFRAQNRYRHGSFGVLDALGEDGEFKNKAIPDGTKQSITVKTKGNIIAISRQALINDDLDAFSRLAVMLGRSAKLSIEVDVYALLAQNAGLGPTMADSVALFDLTAHGNVGSAAAISVVSLDADRVLMLSQKDQDGNEFLELRPSILLVPASLGATAKVINDAQYDPDTSNKLQRPNSMRAVFSKIVDTPRITGTRRYLFADPGVAPVLDVAFYQGVQEPFLENRLGWRVDGTEMKVRLDYGVGAIDTKGAVTNAGV